MSGSTPTTSTTAIAVPDYLKAFVDHLVNWDYVDELFSKALISFGDPVARHQAARGAAFHFRCTQTTTARALARRTVFG